MKKLYFASLMLALATTASAQFTQSTKTATASTTEADTYSSIYFQYNPQSLSYDGHSESGYNGFAIGYNKGTCIGGTTPIYLEYGALFQYTNYSDGDKYSKTKINMGSVKVPVNITYRFAMPNSSVCIAPYAGLNAKFHIWGNTKIEYDDDYYDDESCNLFDDDDMGGDACKRFQLGWQIGVNIAFKKCYVGIGYGEDFSEFSDECKFHTTSITLGFNL